MEDFAGVGSMALYVFGLGFWDAVSVGVGKIARCKGYDFLNWFLAGVFMTPSLGALLVAGLPDRHLQRKLDTLNSWPASLGMRIKDSGSTS